MESTPISVQVQRILRKNSLALPGVILFFSSLIVVYKHFFVDEGSHNSTKLMFIILLTNLPIFYLDVRMPSSSDPLGMLSRMGPKVLILHAIFLASRFDLLWHSHVFMLNFTNVAGFSLCLASLFIGFKLHECFSQHLDAVSLVLLSIGSAAGTEIASSWSSSYYKNRWLMLDVIHTSSMYTELLSFLPACYILWKFEKKDSSSTLSESQLKTQTFSFIIFIVGFYLFEDLVTLLYYGEGWFMLSSHLFHYGLLLDLSFFLFSYAVDPSTNKGTLLMRFTDSFSDSV